MFKARRPYRIFALTAFLLSAALAAQAQIQRGANREPPAPPPPAQIRSIAPPSAFPLAQAVQPAAVPLPTARPSTAPAAQPTAESAQPVGPPAPAETPDAAPKKTADAAPAVPAVSERALKMVRTAPEQIGQVPSHFFWIKDGLMAVRDPVDSQLVFLNDEGRVAGRATFPAGFEIGDIIAGKDDIRLIDASNRGQITIPRNVDPAATTALQEQTIASNGSARQLRLRRRGPQELVVQDERRSGRPLEVRSVAGGALAQAYEIGVGAADTRYVVSEEIAGAKPALQVRVFVQRFDRAGKLTGVANVPLDGMDAVPRDFVTVTGNGVVRVLVPAANGIKINEIELTAPKAGRRLDDDEIKSLGRSLREIPVETNVMGDTRTPFRREAPVLEIPAATPPIKRDAVLENARAFLTVNWVMQRENFEKPGVDNSCEPAHAKFWRRPRRFTEASIGTTIGPMPYRWGGEDTPQTYRLRTEWGALAGSICTCRDVTLNYCLFPESAGVDCSGFVSRAWGIDKRGTAGLLDVADELNDVGEIKPGDAFDWPERHVRLFTGLAPGAATAFIVLESSTRLECEGVCERRLRPSEVNGFRIIRFRGIGESGVAATGAPPADAVTTAAVPTAAGPNESAKRRAVEVKRR